MSKPQDDTLTREQWRLFIAMVCMAAEISTGRAQAVDNSELAARGLRRADSLLQQHEESQGRS